MFGPECWSGSDAKQGRQHIEIAAFSVLESSATAFCVLGSVGSRMPGHSRFCRSRFWRILLHAPGTTLRREVARSITVLANGRQGSSQKYMDHRGFTKFISRYKLPSISKKLCPRKSSSQKSFIGDISAPSCDLNHRSVTLWSLQFCLRKFVPASLFEWFVPESPSKPD